jgi:SpoVK/Ycf46/Vps4 family AAA+-type ATPase
MTKVTPHRGDDHIADSAGQKLDPACVVAANKEFRTWSRGQEEACNQLTEVADAFFEMDWGSTGLRPRLDSLIVGPSGTGKSHLIRMLSRKLGIPRLRLSFSEWVVMAARERPPTLGRVHEFVSEHPRGFIHIDEIDKFRLTHTSDWSTSVFMELFLLLDRSLHQPSQHFQWSGHLQEKLFTSFLILGSGTWQSIWDRREKTEIGFQTKTQSFPITLYRDIQKGGVIPEELLRRFSSDLIVMPIPREDDYRRAAANYGLPQLAHQLGITLDYAAAAEGGLGARWLEETLARLLRAARRNGKPLFSSRETEVPVESDDEEFSDSETPF